MKFYHKNPRTMSEKDFTLLTAKLRKLGDLSGVVHNLNSGEIIGGNMRSRAFDVNQCPIEYTKKLDAPDAQGTVAHGFVVWEGNRYAYREVRWDAKTCEEANICANQIGGDWDFDILANEFEMPELLTWGFEEKQLLGMGSFPAPDFQPVGADEQGRLDQKSPVTCPKCGETFVPKN